MKNIKCLSAVAAAVLSVCVCPVSAETPTIASAADTLAAGCWAALPLTGEIEDIVIDGTLVTTTVAGKGDKKLSGAKSNGTVNGVEFGGSFSGDGGMTSTPEVKNSNNCTDCNVSDTSYGNILKSAFEGTSAAEHQVFTFAGLTANATYLVQYICHGQTEYPRTATVSDVYGVHRIELSAASGNPWYYGGTLLHVFKAAADGTYTLTIDFRDATGANANALVNAFQVRQIEDRAAPAVPATGIWSAQMVSKDAHEFTTEGELVWAMTCSSGDPGHTHYVNRIPFGDCGINTSDFHLSDYAAFSPALTEAQDKFGSEDCGNDAMTFGGTLARGWFINSSSGTGSFTMTVKGLTAGETYRVQLFSHNNGINTDHNDGLPTDTITAPDGVQTIQLGDPDPSDGDMSWRYGGILNGTFIATGTEQAFTFTHTRTGYYQINAIQLRHVASMPPEEEPEPTTDPDGEWTVTPLTGDGDACVIADGRQVFAYALGNYTINGVQFTANPKLAAATDVVEAVPGYSYQDKSDLNNHDTTAQALPDGNWKSLLGNGWFCYNTSTPANTTFSFKGLTKGAVYKVQLLVHNGNNVENPAHSMIAPDGQEGYFSRSSTGEHMDWDLGSSFVGRFIATGTVHQLSFTFSSKAVGWRNLNAIQLREIRLPPIAEQAAALKPTDGWLALPMQGSATDFVTNGTCVAAYAGASVGNDGTVAGVPFVKPDSSACAPEFTISGFSGQPDANYYNHCGKDGTDYGRIMNNAWNGGGTENQTKSFVVNNLTAGKNYLVQVIIHNGRGRDIPGFTNNSVDEFAKKAYLGNDTTGPSVQFGAGSADGEWYYGGTFVKVFTASDTSYSFAIYYPSDYPQFNAIQLRELPVSSEPVLPTVGSVSADVDETSATITLADVDIGTDVTGATAATSYDVYAYTGAGPATVPVVTGEDDATASFMLADLAPGAYTYSIYIVNNEGVSSATNTVEFTVEGPFVPPTDPSGEWTAAPLQADGTPFSSEGTQIFAVMSDAGANHVNTAMGVPFNTISQLTDYAGYFTLTPSMTSRKDNRGDEGKGGNDTDFGGMLKRCWEGNASKTATFAFKGLKPGGVYLAQFFEHEHNPNNIKGITSPDGMVKAYYGNRSGEIEGDWTYGGVLSGLFTATNTVHELQIKFIDSGSYQLNALQLREIVAPAAKSINEQASELEPGDWFAAAMTGSPDDIVNMGTLVRACAPYAIAGDESVNGVAFGTDKGNTSVATHLGALSVDISGGPYNGYGSCDKSGNGYALLMTGGWYGSGTTKTFNFVNLEAGKTYLVQLIVHDGRQAQWTRTATAEADSTKSFRYGSDVDGDWYYGGTLIHVFTTSGTSYSFNIDYDPNGAPQINAIQLRDVTPVPDVPVYTLTIPPKTGLELVSVTTNGTAVAGTDNAYSIVSNTEVTVTFAAESGWEITGGNPVVLTIEADKTFADADYPAVKEQPKPTIGRQAADLAAAFLAGTSSEQWLGLPMTGSPDDIVTTGTVVFAQALSKSGGGSDASVNNVVFSGSQDGVTFSGQTIATADNGFVYNGDHETTDVYGKMLNEAWKSTLNGHTVPFTLNGLISGHSYIVQMVVYHGKQHDNTVTAGGKTICYSSNSSGDWFYGGTFIHVFTATDATYTFNVAYTQNDMYNMLQVRDVTPVTPRSINEQAAELKPGDWFAAAMTGSPDDIVNIGTLVASAAKNAIAADDPTVNGVPFSADKGILSVGIGTGAEAFLDLGLSGGYGSMMKNAWYAGSGTKMTFTYSNLTPGAVYLMQLVVHDGRSDNSPPLYSRKATVPGDAEQFVQYGAATSSDEWYYGGTLIHVFQAEGTTYAFDIDYPSNAPQINAIQLRVLPKVIVPVVPSFTPGTPVVDGTAATITLTDVVKGTDSTGAIAATTYDVLLAYAPQGDELPELTAVLTEQTEVACTKVLTGLEPTTTYSYKVVISNNLGGISTEYTGTFTTATPIISINERVRDLNDGEWLVAPMSGRLGDIVTNGTLVLTTPNHKGSMAFSPYGITGDASDANIDFVSASGMFSESTSLLRNENLSGTHNAYGDCGMSGAYGKILNNGWNGNGKNVQEFVFYGLQVGQTYLVQGFIHDGRADSMTRKASCDGQTIQYGDVVDGEWYYGGTFVHIFTPESSTYRFEIDYTQGEAQLNAIQLRKVSIGDDPLAGKTVRECASTLLPGRWLAMPMQGAATDIITEGDINTFKFNMQTYEMAYAKGTFTGDDTVGGVRFRDSKDHLSISPTIASNGSGAGDCGKSGDYATILSTMWNSGPSETGHVFTYSDLVVGQTYLVQIIIHSGKFGETWSQQDSCARTAVITDAKNVTHTIQFGSFNADDRWYYGGTFVHVFTATETSYSFTVKYYNYDPYNNKFGATDGQLNAIQLRKVERTIPTIADEASELTAADGWLALPMQGRATDFATNGTCIAATGASNAFSGTGDASVAGIPFRSAKTYFVGSGYIDWADTGRDDSTESRGWFCFAGTDPTTDYAKIMGGARLCNNDVAVTLNQLEVGRDYLIQIFIHNGRYNGIQEGEDGTGVSGNQDEYLRTASIDGQTVQYGGKTSSDEWYYGGTLLKVFHAESSTYSFTVNYAGGPGGDYAAPQYNAVQVRLLPEVVRPSFASASADVIGTVATVTLSGVIVGTDAKGNAATSYDVYAYTGDDPSVAEKVVEGATAATASFQLSNMKKGDYTYTVFIVNDKGMSSEETEVDFTIEDAGELSVSVSSAVFEKEDGSFVVVIGNLGPYDKLDSVAVDVATDGSFEHVVYSGTVATDVTETGSYPVAIDGLDGTKAITYYIRVKVATDGTPLDPVVANPVVSTPYEPVTFEAVTGEKNGSNFGSVFFTVTSYGELSSKAAFYVDATATGDFDDAATTTVAVNVEDAVPFTRRAVAYGLDPSTSYTARIRAVNEKGVVSTSQTFTIATTETTDATSLIWANVGSDFSDAANFVEHIAPTAASTVYFDEPVKVQPYLDEDVTVKGVVFGGLATTATSDSDGYDGENFSGYVMTGAEGATLTLVNSNTATTMDNDGDTVAASPIVQFSKGTNRINVPIRFSGTVNSGHTIWIDNGTLELNGALSSVGDNEQFRFKSVGNSTLRLGGDTSRFTGLFAFKGSNPKLVLANSKALDGFTTIFSSAWGSSRYLENATGETLRVPSLRTFYMGAIDGFGISGDPVEFPNAALECHGDSNHDKGITYSTLVTFGKIVLYDGSRVVVNGSETGGLVNLGALEAGPAGTPLQRWVYVNEGIYVACVKEGLGDSAVVRSSSWGSRKPMLGLGFDWAATIGADPSKDTDAFAGENGSQDYFFGLAAWGRDQTVTLFGDATQPLFCTKASDSNASYHAPGRLSFGNVNAKGTLTLANPVDLNGSGRTFYAYDGAAYVDGRIAGGIVSSADASKNIEKRGFGIIAVDGDMTFTGDSTVYEGGLLVNGACVNKFTVGSNSQPAMLGGTGTLRDVNVGPNATLRPGELGGTLTVAGKLKFYSNAVLEIDVGSDTAGCVKLTGTTEFNDPFIVKVNAIGDNAALFGRVKIIDWSELGSAPDFKKAITVQYDEACFSSATLEKSDDGYYLNYQGKTTGFMMIIAGSASPETTGALVVEPAASGAGYNWFDACVGSYTAWPSAGSLVVDSIGAWSNTGAGSLVDGTDAKEIVVSATTAAPLVFVADTTRSVISGIAGFSASAKFATLPPVSSLTAPSGAIGAITAAMNGDIAAYYGLVNGAWVALSGATPAENSSVRFAIDVKTDSDALLVRYTVNGTVLTSESAEWLASAGSAAALQAVAFAGFGSLAGVGGSSDPAASTVAMTIPAIDNVNVEKVTVNGLEIEGTDGVYDVPSGEAVVVAFSGADGYSVSTDTMRFPADTVDFTLPETGRPVAMFIGDVLLINEIMASNGETLKTKNGAALDWVEIRNLSDEPIDITGWYLYDDPAKAKSKWKKIKGHAYIPANGYKVIWCDKDYADFDEVNEAWSEIGLSTSGETVFLADPYGNVCDTVVMGTQMKDISYGVGKMPDTEEETLVFFNEPTPGAPNGEFGYGPMTPAVAFSVPHGYKTAPIDVEITCADDPDADIYYTLDGTQPTATNPSAVKYTTPIHIESTKILRAGVPQENTVLQVDSSATYIYLNDVLAQDRVETGADVPAGFPESSAKHTMRYGMIQGVVNGEDRERILRGFTNTVATLSIVMDPVLLFGTEDGIYVNSRKYMLDGAAGERPMLLEQIDPVNGAANEFSVPGGLRLRGSSSLAGSNPKHSLRFFFRGKYGMAKLNFPLFGDEGADEFSKVDLRCSQNYSWSMNNSDYDTFIHELFSRDSQRDLGQPYTRTRYYNLFINGQYWGLYMTQERGDKDFGETYLGGNEDYYDCIKTSSQDQYHYVTTANDGTIDAWRNLQGLAYNGFAGDYVDNYNRALGLNPDGTRNEAYPILLNPENLMAYVTIAHFVCDADGPVSVGNGGLNNLYANRYQIDGGSSMDGFWFLRHDAEHSMGVKGEGDEFGIWTQYDKDNTGLGTHEYNPLNPDWSNAYRGEEPPKDDRSVGNFGPYELHAQLAKNPVYRRAFADYFYKHYLKEGGAMTPAVAKQRFEARMAEIDDVIVSEAARWSPNASQPKSRETWLNACSNCLDFIEKRTPYMKESYQARGWYPTLEPPTADVADGEGAIGQVVNFTAADGAEIYVTTDGSDPAESGTLSASATVPALPCTIKARAKLNDEWSPAQEVTLVAPKLTGDGLIITIAGNYTSTQELAPTGDVCRVILDDANVPGGLILKPGVAYTFEPAAETENAIGRIVGGDTSTFVLNGEGTLSMTGSDTLLTVNDLIVSNGTFAIKSTGVSAKKTPIVKVMGNLFQTGGKIDIDVSVDSAVQVYGIMLASKKMEAEFSGGELVAKVGGQLKSAAIVTDKGSSDIVFKKECKITAELSGVDSRLAFSAGEIKFAKTLVGPVVVTMPQDLTGVSEAHVFKAEKTIEINGGTFDINVPATGSEIFSASRPDEAADEDPGIIVIKGGTFELVADDDCFNATDFIDVRDGLFYAVSLSDDVFDSNGGMDISGGTILAYATGAGHEAFDVEPEATQMTYPSTNEHVLAISGGTIFATGGKNSAWPTTITTVEGVYLFSLANADVSAYSGKYLTLNSSPKVTAKLPAFPPASTGSVLATCPGFDGANVSVGDTAPTSGSQNFHDLYIHGPSGFIIIVQ